MVNRDLIKIGLKRVSVT